MTLIPAWSRISGLTGSVTTTGAKQQLMRLTSAAAHKWVGDSAYQGLFKGFALRAISVSAFSVIATATEAMLIDGEIDEAKSLGRRNALSVKKYSVLAMGLVSATQLYFSMGAWAGSSAAGLVVAPWIVIAFALLGIVYLTASLVADALTLNGF